MDKWKKGRVVGTAVLARSRQLRWAMCARACPMRHIQPLFRLAVPQTGHKTQTLHLRGEEVRAPRPALRIPIPTSTDARARTSAPKVIS
jgi:hypothetical protein